MLGIFIIETSFQHQQPARQGSTRGTRWPFTISPPPSISFYLLQAKLQSGDLATPLLLVVALITNASCWQKSSWPSCAKQTKTSLVPGVAAYIHRRGERGQGRQCQSYGKTSTRLVRTGEAFNCTSADRIGADRSRSWSQSQTIARLGRQANWGE